MANARSRVVVLTTLYRAARIAMRPGGPSLPTRLASLPRLVRETLSGRYAGLTMGRLGLMAAAVAYIVSPVDLIPEGAFLLAGLADDAVVMGWLAAALVNETETFLAWEDKARPVTADADSAAAAMPQTVQSTVAPAQASPLAL